MLEARVGEFAAQVQSSIANPQPDTRIAALTSFAYNVGIDNFRKSTLLRKLNAGDIVGACNELPRWNKAKGQVLPGLVKRREAERQLCLKGIRS
jgi:lysozyme